jgi:uncharacterized protein
MPKVRTTLTIEEEVLRWVKVRAARQGKGDSEVIEESLRRDLGLELLERLWERNRLDEADAVALAVEAQHSTRRRRRQWVRAVLDPNVLISGLLGPAGASARLLVRWLAGDFELIVSEHLLAELARALAYPKLRSRITPDEARSFVQILNQSATTLPDSRGGSKQSRDPGDDYLLALAASSAAVLVSGDKDLLVLAPALPICSPSEFLSRLGD